MANSDTFVRITNKNIYDKLEDIEQHQLETNGKVKANTKFIYGIGGGALALAGWFIAHLINIGG